MTRRQSQAGFGDATVLIGILFILVFIIVVMPWRGIKPPVKPPQTNAMPVLPVEWPQNEAPVDEFDEAPWYYGSISRPPVHSNALL